MPLLDVTPQPSFRNQLYSVRFQRVYHVSFLFSNVKTTRLGSSWGYFHIPNKGSNVINTGSLATRRGGRLMIKAVATLEPRCSDKENGNVQLLGIDSTTSLPTTEIQSSSEDSALDDKKRLIRMKISKAMKGKTPWNKGRKHSPETLRRIRERTKIAMQDPKIRMKVAVNLGQTLSEETKMKIKAGVRRHLERYREKQMVQETCHFEWRNLIAEASRKGFCGQEELQWDSYKIIDKQLEKEWIESIEHRKRNRPKGFKRGPPSPEHKRKISQTLSAKWAADPSYRDRVYTGLSKYYGTTVGVGKPRRSRKPRKTNPEIERTRLLIAEAKRAADAQETAAARDPMPQLSVIETRKTNPESQVKSEANRSTKLLITEAKRAAGVEEIAVARDPIAQAPVIETRITDLESQARSEAIKRTKQEPKRAADAEEMAAARDPIARPSVIETWKTKPESLVKSEAVKRTKLLIAEAKRAAEAKEIAAATDPIARAELIETRKLIAKAIRFIESIEAGESKLASSHEHGLVNGKVHPSTSSDDLGLVPLPHTSKKTKRWVRGKLVEVDEDD